MAEKSSDELETGTEVVPQRQDQQVDLPPEAKRQRLDLPISQIPAHNFKIASSSKPADNSNCEKGPGSMSLEQIAPRPEQGSALPQQLAIANITRSEETINDTAIPIEGERNKTVNIGSLNLRMQGDEDEGGTRNDNNSGMTGSELIPIYSSGRQMSMPFAQNTVVYAQQKINKSAIAVEQSTGTIINVKKIIIKENQSASSTKYEDEGTKRTARLPQPVDDNKSEKDLLTAMEKYVLEVTKNSISSTYQNLNEIDHKTHPTMTNTDLTKGNKGKASKFTKNVLESSDKDIKPSGFHARRMGKNSYLAFLVGDVGAGKTTTVEEHVRSVLNGEVEGLEDIEYVHYLSGSDIQDNDPTTAHDLLTEHMALEETTKNYSKNWFKENTKKTLFVLDGLDQSSVDFSGKPSKLSDPHKTSKPSTIIKSILSGKLYSGMRMLATTRWDTFWKLHQSIRCSCRTVVLRGFNDESLEDTIKSLAGEEDGKRISHVLRTKARGLLPLCRSPMFLIYAIAIFKENTENPPDTMTALMSEVLKYFQRSTNWHGADLKTLMKVAYHGTKDKRFVFTKEYLKKIGIDPQKLGGILSSNVKHSYESRPATGDQTWSFPHQSLQEFLAALYIFTEGEQEFNLFAANELNKPDMEIVRKFVYGIVLNPETRRFCEAYVEDGSVSLEVCKETLMKQLDQILSEGVVDDIKIISLLYECGPKVIASYKSRIDRISITDEFLKSEDEHSLMAVIQQCEPMTKVDIIRLELSSSIMKLMRNTLNTEIVKHFKISKIVVGKHIQIDDCNDLNDLLPKAHVDRIYFETTEEIVRALLNRWIEEGEAPCGSFFFVGELSRDSLDKVGEFASEIGTDLLSFDQCQLTKEKVNTLRDNMKKETKLGELRIRNDATMDSEAYRRVASLFGKVHITNFVLWNNGLTEPKLQAFGETAEQDNITLKEVGIIEDSNMDPRSYYGLASMVGKCHAQCLVLQNNGMTKEKLQSFGHGAKDNNTMLPKLRIISDSNMSPDAYRGLAGAIEKAHVKELLLGNNGLTEPKLQVFNDAAEKDNAKLETLSVGNEGEMEPRAYYSLALTVGKTNAKTLQLCNNSITAKKIQEFRKAAEVSNVEFEMLCILAETSLDDECYEEIIGICTKANCKLGLLGCNISDEREQALKMRIRDVSVENE